MVLLKRRPSGSARDARAVLALRILVHIAALVPLAVLLWQYAHGEFLVDPVRETTSRTGRTALLLLVLSLACTPLATVTGLPQVLRVRRALGMYAFLYVGLHFLIFAGLDYGFDPIQLRQAIFDQKYVLVGVAAGLLLVPLAVTSTRGWQRRLGVKWKRLHRLVYLAGIAAVLHFLWLGKDPREPLRWAAVVGILLLFRMPWVRMAVSRGRRGLGLALTRRMRRLIPAPDVPDPPPACGTSFRSDPSAPRGPGTRTAR
jgi:methionine sulfoxide reductase heme-binding subunit